MSNKNNNDEYDRDMRDHPKIREYKKSCIGTKQQSLEKIQKLTHLMDSFEEGLAMKNAVDEESFEMISYLISISKDQSKMTYSAFERAFEKSKSLKFMKFLINLGVKVDSVVISRSAETAPFEIFKFFFQNFATEKEITENLSTWTFGACRFNRFETFKYLIELENNRFDIHNEIDSDCKFTLLQNACHYGCLESAKYLNFERQVSLNQLSQDGETLIFLACRYSQNYELLVFLMETGNFDVNQCDNRGRSPLWMACRANSIESVKYLIEKGAQVNLANNKGETPLMIATTETHVEIVKYLVQNGADVNLKCKSGLSPLKRLVMAEKYHSTVLIGAILIENEADLSICDKEEIEWLNFYVFSFPTVPEIDLEQRDPGGQTRLMLASESGNLRYVQNLVKRGANMNAQNVEGRSALLFACCSGKMDVVKFLVENGVDFDLPNKAKISPIQHALLCDHFEIVKYLIEAGAKTSELLITATLKGNLEILKYLIEKVNFDSKQLATAFYIANDNNHFEMMKYLIEKRLVNFKSLKPYLNLKIAKFLVENGADIDERNGQNLSPIEYAFLWDLFDIVKYLIDVGAKTTELVYTVACSGNLAMMKYLVEKVNFDSEQYEIAFYIANVNNHFEIVKLLIENHKFDSQAMVIASTICENEHQLEVRNYFIENQLIDFEAVILHIVALGCFQLETVKVFIENQLIDFEIVGLTVALGYVELEIVKFFIEGNYIDLKRTIQAICKWNPTMENETTKYLNEKRKKQLERKERKRKIKRKIQKKK